MVDPGRLRALLDRLREETEQLRRLAASDERSLAEPDALAAVKYRFVVAIETCIDAGQHVIASEGLRAPVDYADVFAVLGESGFLPADAVPSLQDMARFRNLLVHGYLNVDDERVVEILRTRLGDLDAFRSALARTALEGPAP
jgi:uncharacterized protein YutE (UPF0331/DUF86 family)